MFAALAAIAVLQATPAWVRVAPEESLRVTIQGDGPAVVLVPGLFGSAWGYRRVLPLLAAAGWSAIVIEPLGIGGSGRPPRADYSLTAQATRIAAALDSLRVRGAIVVAHAVGASIALRLAAHRHDLVAGVVSLDGGVAEAAATPGFRRALSFAPWIRLVGGRRLIRAQIRRQLTTASADGGWVTDDVVAGYTAPFTADLGAALIAFLRLADAREPVRLSTQLASVRCPVTLVLGAVPHASSVPEREVALLLQSLPALTVDSVPGVGHFLHEERPEAVVAAVTRMRTVVVAAATAGR